MSVSGWSRRSWFGCCLVLVACGGKKSSDHTGTGGAQPSNTAGSTSASGGAAGTAGSENQGGSGGRAPNSGAGRGGAGRSAAGGAAGGSANQAGAGGSDAASGGRARGGAGSGGQPEGGATPGGAAGAFDGMTPAPVVDVLNDCTLSSSEPGEPLPTTLPSTLTNANWSVKADACEQGGFDLTTCAGEMATMYPFQQTVEKNAGHPTTAWVIAVGDTICCVYLTDDSTPGVYPAECD